MDMYHIAVYAFDHIGRRVDAFQTHIHSVDDIPSKLKLEMQECPSAVRLVVDIAIPQPQPMRRT